MEVTSLVEAFFDGSLTGSVQDVINDIIAEEFETKRHLSSKDITPEFIKSATLGRTDVPKDDLSLRLLISQSPLFTRQVKVAVHFRCRGQFDTTDMTVSIRFNSFFLRSFFKCNLGIISFCTAYLIYHAISFFSFLSAV